MPIYHIRLERYVQEFTHVEIDAASPADAADLAQTLDMEDLLWGEDACSDPRVYSVSDDEQMLDRIEFTPDEHRAYSAWTNRSL